MGSEANHAAIMAGTIREAPLIIPYVARADEDDTLSIKMFASGCCTSRIAISLLRLARVLEDDYPLSITSSFRPTGTHKFGAIDLAPDGNDPVIAELYAHYKGVDPRLYARLPLLRHLEAVLSGFPDLTMLVEDNHFHVHDNGNPGVPSTLPKGGVLIQIRPRANYDRTAKDEDDDELLISKFYWARVSSIKDDEFPEFSPRW
jgi:hypothetical protein